MTRRPKPATHAPATEVKPAIDMSVMSVVIADVLVPIRMVDLDALIKYRGFLDREADALPLIEPERYPELLTKLREIIRVVDALITLRALIEPKGTHHA